MVMFSLSLGQSLFVRGLLSICVLFRCPLSVSLSPVSVYFHMSQEVQRCVFSMLSVVSIGIKPLSHLDP